MDAASELAYHDAMFPSIETIAAQTNYATLIHIKARLERRLFELGDRYNDLYLDHSTWCRSDEGRRHYTEERGKPFNKRTSAATMVAYMTCGEELAGVNNILAAVMARLNEVSPPPVETPKKIKLYDEPWHG